MFESQSNYLIKYWIVYNYPAMILSKHHTMRKNTIKFNLNAWFCRNSFIKWSVYFIRYWNLQWNTYYEYHVYSFVLMSLQKILLYQQIWFSMCICVVCIFVTNKIYPFIDEIYVNCERDSLSIWLKSSSILICKWTKNCVE